MNDRELTHLASLSGLSLGADEARALEVDLARIVAYVGELAGVDTAGVEPLVSPLDAVAPLRDDAPRPDDPRAREAALAAAPDAEGGAFAVPGVGR